MMNEAQDPAEPFDIVLADGTPTGRTKPRAEVHRDGDWHRAVHVWVAGHDEVGQPFLMFQQRSLLKDTWPGWLDATVGGHYRAGESLEQAIREVEEEIGVVADLAELRPLGVRICINELNPGVTDHELQDLFLLVDDRPLTGYRPHPVELAALVRFPLADLLPVLAGAEETVAGQLLMPGACDAVQGTFQAGDFVKTVDRYFYRVAIAVANALRGDVHVAV